MGSHGATQRFCVQDCGPLGGSVRVNDRGFLRLLKTSLEDAGKYTCLADVSIDGKIYTAARSVQVNVKEGRTSVRFNN